MLQRIIKAKFVDAITVIDPDSKGEVIVEIYKDPVSDGMFGVDSSFIEQVDNIVPSPFNKNVQLKLDED